MGHLRQKKMMRRTIQKKGHNGNYILIATMMGVSAEFRDLGKLLTQDRDICATHEYMEWLALPILEEGV